jgi:hypothetical protein
MSVEESPQPDRQPPKTTDDTTEHDPRVSTIPLDTEDGGTVVIEQQNVGPGSQIGEGEFKPDDEVSVHKTPEEAAAEQDELEHQAPTDGDR